jgi:RNA 2'-phosphotransferase, Tpt1 / KptA family
MQQSKGKTEGFALLSKTISHALRHEPWLYELELDDEGWVPVDELFGSLRKEKPEWTSLTEADLAEMIARSDKNVTNYVTEKSAHSMDTPFPANCSKSPPYRPSGFIMAPHRRPHALSSAMDYARCPGTTCISLSTRKPLAKSACAKPGSL